MKSNELDAMIPQVDAALVQWAAAMPGLQPTFTFQGASVTKEELNDSLVETLAAFVDGARSSNLDPLRFYIHRNGVINAINSVINTVPQVPSNPQAYMEQLMNHLWGLQASLVWILPPNQGAERLATAAPGDSDLQFAAALRRELIDAVSRTRSGLIESTAALDSINKNLELTKGHEREAGNAKVNADASAAAVLANKLEIDTALTAITNGGSRQTDLITNLEELQDKATSALESASQVGLAKSFASRRVALGWPQRTWAIAFSAGISVLVIGSYFATVSDHFLPMINKTGTFDPWGVAARFLLAGPVVWFTWFAARQYGHVMRLIEDYAFKEAAALAFLGYKREMGSDEEMLKLLRESAIKSFAASPTRMLVKDEPSSPLQEVLNKLVATGNIEKISEFVKALNPKR